MPPGKGRKKDKANVAVPVEAVADAGVAGGASVAGVAGVGVADTGVAGVGVADAGVAIGGGFGADMTNDQHALWDRELSDILGYADKWRLDLMDLARQYDAPEDEDEVAELVRRAGKMGRRCERLVVDMFLHMKILKERLDNLSSPKYVEKIAAAAVKAAMEAVAPADKPAVIPVVTASAVNPVAFPGAVHAVPPVAAVSAANPVVLPGVVAAAAPSVAMPVETWSVVVRSKKGLSSKEVLEKVDKQVGPSLGVRVHEMKPLRDGGAVIRTRSAAEREKIVKNLKFKEAGLSVSVNENFGPKVVVCRVHSEITAEELMADLYELNLKNMMNLEKFKKSVRIVSKPSGIKGGCVDVVLEGDEAAMKRLLEAGSVYVKWFSFRTRMQDAVPHCFRCLGFDHRIGQCRYEDIVCRRCGQGGHLAPLCGNPISCRNCKFRGLPSGHLMLSLECPQYATLVARAMARH